MKNFINPLLKEKGKQLEEMGFRTRLEIPLGDPALEINRVARETGASVIVAGTHGESLAKDILLGSVVHRSTIPVLVVQGSL
jgi:nucleotide-binding universal stress UspA family protein